MSWWRGSIAAAAAGLLAAAPARAATLEVTVTDVRNANGHVLAAVCPASEFLSDHCRYVEKAPARRGSVNLRITDVPPGTYAVQVFHDENDNMKIDRTLLGLPEEGMAFSNNAPFRFGPPSFGDAAIAIGAQGGVISVRMRYF